MKKNLCLIIAAVMMLCCIGANAGYDIAINFNATEKSLDISGSIGENADSLVTVSIDKYTEENKTFSSDNPPMATELFTTEENGAVNFKMPVSKEFDSGKYKVYINSPEGKYTAAFMFVNENDASSKEVLAKINAAESKTAVLNIISSDGDKLGIDTQELSVHLDYAAEIVYSLKEKTENKKYTAETFYNTFFGGVAASMIKQGNVNGAISKYADMLGTSYKDYEALNSDIRTELGLILKQADFTSAFPEEIYHNAYILALFKKSESYAHIEEYAAQYQKELAIDMGNSSKYMKISAPNRSKVFIAMYGEKNGYTDLEDIKKSFEKFVDKVYSDTYGSSAISGGGGGGTGGSSVISSTGAVILPNTPVDEPKDVFSDIKSHFAENDVMRLAKMGVVNGYADGTFKPDEGVTRAEFSKMIVLAFGIKGRTSESFNDVDDNDWFAQYVNVLSGAGIVRGFDGLFMPESNISRQDCAVIIHRILAEIDSASESGFGDKDNISDYALNSVCALTDAGILKGDGVNFYPKNTVTRGEAASIISRAYDMYNGGAE